MADLTTTTTLSGVTDIKYDDSRGLLYLSSNSGAFYRWDPHTGTLAASVALSGPSSSFDLTADNRFALVERADTGVIERLDLSSLTYADLAFPVSNPFSGGMADLAIASDGNALATFHFGNAQTKNLYGFGATASSLSLHDVVGEYDDFQLSGTNLTSSEHHRYVLIGFANGGGLELYDAAAGAVTRHLDFPSLSTGHGDVSEAAGLISETASNAVYVFDLALAQQTLLSAPQLGEFTVGKFSADGHQLFVIQHNRISGDDQLLVYDCASWTQVGSMSLPVNIGDTAFVQMARSGDGRMIFLSNGSTLEALDLSARLHLTVNGDATHTQLFGSVGSDTITGSAADDTIDGGGGDDALDGGGGANAVSYASASAAVTVSLALQGQTQVTGGAGTDTLTNFQNLVGSAFNDTLAGDSNNNVIDGGGGTNTVTYAAAGAAVTVDLWTGAASGTASGSDTLLNIQNVIGSAYDDTFAAGSHSGRYDGGAGVNTLDFSHETGGVTIDLVQALVSGSGFSDALVNIQHVVGSNQNDSITFGSASATVTGGLGADTFVYGPGAGNAVITDFTHAQGDKIVLSAYGELHTLQDIKLHAAQQGGDTVITLRNGTLTLQGVQLANLTENDFNLSSASHLNADINGDHQADIIFRDPSTGDWGYAAMTDHGYDWRHFGNSGVNYAVAGTGDFNGDGVPDVIFRDPSTGDWGYAAMNSQGYTWVHLGNSGVAYSVAGTGDFNHDGLVDVLFRDPSTGDWGYAAMTHQGYNWTHLGNSGVNYAVAGTGDFNGDGRTDALFRDPSTGDWGYAAMTPQGFDWHHFGNSGVNYAVAGTGDFNGDGVTDVLFRDPSTGDWGYAAMSAQGFTWVHLGNSGANYTVGGTGDFNGDGRADVIFRDSSTGDWGYAAMTPAGFDWHHEGNSGLTYLIS